MHNLKITNTFFEKLMSILKRSVWETQKMALKFQLTKQFVSY